MLRRFRKRAAPAFTDVAPGGLHDIHSHVLPGVDDGAADHDESHAMLDGLADLGYARVAATPHQHHGVFETHAREHIVRVCNLLEGQRGARPPRIVPGAEIWFDERVLEPQSGEALPGYGSSRTLLVEFGGQPGSLPRGLETLVFKLGLRSAVLVIAHPERYPDIQRDPERLAPLRLAGAVIQVDLLSLVGGYGGRARDAAWGLVESGAADAVATDLHRAADLPAVRRSLGELLEWDPDEFVRLASTNPAAILDGDPAAITRH